MDMRLNLKHYLDTRNISTYQLVKATHGLLADTTVYHLARKPVQRIDLSTIGVILNALRSLTGQPVILQDLIQQEDAPLAPEYMYLLKDAKPFDWDAATKHITPFTAEELAQDEIYWQEKRQYDLEHERKRYEELDS